MLPPPKFPLPAARALLCHQLISRVAPNPHLHDGKLPQATEEAEQEQPAGTESAPQPARSADAHEPQDQSAYEGNQANWCIT